MEPISDQSGEGVLEFWFGRASDPWFGKWRPEWFRQNAAFDAEIRARFGALHAEIAAGSSREWLHEPRSALAYVIVLDQFSRNLFRGQPQAFASDQQARAASEQVLARGFDRKLPPLERSFLYLPFVHSEELADQERSVKLYEELAREDPSSQNLSYAIRHRDIIARFGRFPHRNQVLGRSSSEEETSFLREPNSAF